MRKSDICCHDDLVGHYAKPENKFPSYTAASDFFRQQGFDLVQEAVPDHEALSVLPHLLAVLPVQVRNSKESPPKIQATWMLQPE